PVASAPILGLGELVADGEQARLGRPGRAAELAAPLARLARDPRLRERLGRAGRERVIAEFDVRESGRRLARLFAAAAAAAAAAGAGEG
ncbi:MAG: glycosyltransferase, partial [Solirubrobacterales bacterium]